MLRAAKAAAAAIYVAGMVPMARAAAGEPYVDEHPVSYWAGVAAATLAWPLVVAFAIVATANDVYHDRRPPAV